MAKSITVRSANNEIEFFNSSLASALEDVDLKVVVSIGDGVLIDAAVEHEIKYPLEVKDADIMVNNCDCIEPRNGKMPIRATFTMFNYIGCCTDAWINWVRSVKLETFDEQFELFLCLKDAKITPAVVKNRIGIPGTTIPDLSSFDLYYEFAQTHGEAHRVLTPPRFDLDWSHIPFIDLLSPNEVIVAGGAAAHGFCPTLPFGDIDYFITDTECAVENLMALIKAAQTMGYVVCKAGPSVFTAVGTYPQKPLQFIVSSFETSLSVIENFDLGYVRCYFDGTYAQRTLDCKRSHDTRVCLEVGVGVNAFRLRKAKRKHFQISKLAEQTIQESKIKPDGHVYLVPGIPKEDQMFMLKKMKLNPLELDFKLPEKLNGFQSTDPIHKYGTGTNEAINSDALLQHCSVDRGYRPHQNMIPKISIIFLKSLYKWTLPTAVISVNNINRSEQMLNKVEILHHRDVAEYAHIHDTLTRCDGGYIKRSWKSYFKKHFYDMSLNTKKATVFLADGETVMCADKMVWKEGMVLRIIGFPSHICTPDNSEYQANIKWKVTSIYVQ
jgi:hypothetical protein